MQRNARNTHCEKNVWQQITYKSLYILARSIAYHYLSFVFWVAPGPGPPKYTKTRNTVMFTLKCLTRCLLVYLVQNCEIFNWRTSWSVNLLILPRGSLYIIMSIFPRLTRCTESISSPSCRIWWPGRWWWRCIFFDNAFKQLSSKSWKRNECERTVRCIWRWISYWRPSGNFLRTCNQIQH